MGKIAEFDGRCPACDESIVAEADEIAQNADGEWCHEDCASE